MAIARIAVFISFVVVAFPSLAFQDPAKVKQAVIEFLRVETKGLPGQVSYEVGDLDPNTQLASCTAMEVSLPLGARAWGHSHVNVRCRDEAGWSLFVPVRVKVIADYLVIARPLVRGQSVTKSHLAHRRGDLADLPTSILSDEHWAIGRVALVSAAAGRPLRADMLRAPYAVRQNQTVRVVSAGPGFEVSNEGKALGQAEPGHVVQVRLPNGQVVSGVAREDGSVEIGF